jgi:hypothetical protein
MATPHAFKYLVLAIQRQVIVELRDKNMRKKVRTSHAARDWTTWCGLLHHPLAAAARLLDPGNLDHLHLRRDHIEKLADIFTRRTKGAHRVAPKVRIGSHAFGVTRRSPPQSGQQVPGSSSRRSRGVTSETRGTAQSGRISRLWDRFIRPSVNGSVIVFCHGDQQVFQRQFQLLNLAFDLFRGFAKGQFLEFGYPQAKGLNQLVVDPQCCGYLCVFRLQSRDHRLQCGGIIGQGFGEFRHAPDYQKPGKSTI